MKKRRQQIEGGFLAKGEHLLSGEVALAQDGEPPKEFRIFAAGRNSSYKGSYLFDALAADAVLADLREHGQEYLAIDYNHASTFTMFSPDPAKSGEAAGWFKPELRNGELWATSVDWCNEAKGRLKEKKYRYHSATFRTDDKDERIVSLRCLALTNTPAIHGQEALMSQETPDPDAPQETTMDKKLIALSLGLPAEATDAEIQAALSANATALKQFGQLTGKNTPAEILGVLTAWQQGAARAETLSQEIATLRKTQEDAARLALLDQGAKEGKLPPALAEVAKTWSVEQLQAYLKAAVPLVPLSQHTPPKAGNPATRQVELTQEDLEVAAQMGLDVEKLKARKQATGGRIAVGSETGAE